MSDNKSKSGFMGRGLVSAGGLLLVAVLFFAVNILANATLGTARLDLTADRLFTLSSGTRAVLAKIGEPITLRFYFSDRLAREIPSYGLYAARVREMLEEYRSAAKGKIRLEIIDPQPFTDDEDRAVGYGLQGVPVSQGGEQVYFGLAGVNSADKEEIISFFQPERERFLEYDLTKLVFNLTTTKKKAVGLLSALPLQGEFRGPRQPPEPWIVYNQLAQFFDIRQIDREAGEIPADIGVLMIVHPRDLPEGTLYAIDQFVLRGGRALIFVDPHAEGDMLRPGVAAQTGATSSDLKRLFDAWGLEVVQGKLAADRLAARRVNAGTESRVRAVDYVLWLNLRDNNFNRDDILTAETGSIQMASAGILKAKPGATTIMTPLIQTSAQSEEIDADSVKFAPDPVIILANFKASGERLTLAARIRGNAKTAFPDGPPPPKEATASDDKQPAEATPAPVKKDVPPTAQIVQSREPINVIVVADTDMLEDRFWVQVQDFFGQRIATPTASNGDFVVNAVDNLSGSDELIGLRSRGQSARPFALVRQIQREAELRFRTKERELTDKLRDTEKKLNDLQTQSQGGGQEAGSRLILSKAQQEAIEQFRADLVKTRKELRDVQHELRRDIDTLEATLKFVNIALIPILVGLAAIILGVLRLRRRRSFRRSSGTRTAQEASP